MEYIEKAKYELIMAIKNNETKEVIDFLRQYYDDMVKICSLTYGEHKMVNNQNVKYILNISELDEINSFCFMFSDENSLIDFCEKYKKNDMKITVTEVHNINPENNYRPNFEEKYDVWLQNKVRNNRK